MAQARTPQIRWRLRCWRSLFERPMHPYEMAATLKQRHKEESIKLRYGSLYTRDRALLRAGMHRGEGDLARRQPAGAHGL